MITHRHQNPGGRPTSRSGGSPPRTGCRRVLAGLLAGCLLAPLAGWAQGLFVDAGDILSANYLGNRVVRLNPQTGVQQSLGDFVAPMDLALTADGELYVAELAGAIKRLTLTNGALALVNPGSSLNAARGLVVGPTGELFVTGRSNTTYVVMRINPVTAAEVPVTEGDLLALPTGIEFLDADHLVVASFLNNTIVKVRLADGVQSVLAQGGQWIDRPWGLAVSGDTVYAGHYDSKQVNRISASTLAVSPLANAPGPPYGLGLDAQGNLVVGAAANVTGQSDMLVIFSPAGSTLVNYDVGLRQQISGIEVARARFGTPPPNNPPQLDPIANRTLDEGASLSFQVAAADPNVPPQILRFSLDPGAPPGAAITPVGLFSWSTTEADGPGVHTVTVRVTDDGTPPLADVASFTVTVNEVNTPPSLDPIPEQQVSAGGLLSVTNVAHDADLPAQALAFSLESGADLGASVSPEGVLTWSPTALQAPSTNTLVVRVADGGTPSLSATNLIRVVVHEVNTPPALSPVAPQTVGEGVLLTFRVQATDTNQPAQSLTFSLGPGAPAGAGLTADGMFAWTPGEEQGPGEHTVTVIVTDNGLPPLRATNVFAVTVNEVNAPPILAPIQPQTIMVSNLLSFSLTASDPDQPPQTFALSFAGTPPAGASLSPQGEFTWTPTPPQAPRTHLIGIRVQDTGSPPLASTQTVSVLVKPQVALEVGDILVADPGGNSILKINPVTGAQQWLDGFEMPTDLDLAPNGRLYVSEWAGLVKELNLTNGLIRTLNPGTALTDLEGLVIGPDGGPLVASAALNRVTRIDPVTGAESLVTQGDLLSGPYGIDLLDAGQLVVSSSFNNRLVAVSLADGTQRLLAEENGLSFPWGVAVGGTNVYIAGYGSQAIQHLTNGAAAQVHPTGNAAPAGIAVNADGEIVTAVGGPDPGRVLRIRPDGTLLQAYSGGLLGAGTGVEVVGARVGPVLPPNAAPATRADLLERGPTTGAKISITTLLANDSDPDGHPIQVFSVDALSAQGGTVTRDGDWIFYAPPAGFTNADSFSYRIVDSYNTVAVGSVLVQVVPDLVPSPNLVLTDLGHGSYLLQFDGIPGKTYRIERTDTLSPPAWEYLGGNTAGPTGSFEFTDTPPPGLPERFYRSVYP